MLVIVDYGVGNLFSLKCSFAKINADVVFSGDRDLLENADKIILPGVGAFAEASKKLKASGLGDVIIERAKKGGRAHGRSISPLNPRPCKAPIYPRDSEPLP